MIVMMKEAAAAEEEEEKTEKEEEEKEEEISKGNMGTAKYRKDDLINGARAGELHQASQSTDATAAPSPRPAQ